MIKLPILMYIGDDVANLEQLKRALDVAPNVIAASGIDPVGQDSEAFRRALKHVIDPKNGALSKSAYAQLTAADEIIADADKQGRPDTSLDLLTESKSLAELAILYSWPLEDAAYTLGLAIGLTFACGIGGGVQ
jgi:hypothetical protein